MLERAGAPPLPRSFLYIPASRPELFAKGMSSEADAVILDLEDAVPLSDKAAARVAVREWLDGRSDHDGAACAEQWVRVDATALDKDLDAAVQPGLNGVFLAKATTQSVGALVDRLTWLEPRRGLMSGSVRIVGLLETAAALVDLPTLVRTSRLTTLGIGEVDLLADLRMVPGKRSHPAVLSLRAQVVAYTAAAGLAAPVAPTSTDYRNLGAFAESTRLLRDLGFRSRTAIHPAQVVAINEVFTPTVEEVRSARSVVDRFEAAGGGVTTDERGRLIDAAVVRTARETLSRAGRSRQPHAKPSGASAEATPPRP